jgi:hypothetical protein
MKFHGDKYFLKIQIAFIALILTNGTLFAQKYADHNSGIKQLLLSNERNQTVYSEISLQSIFDKMNLYTITETVPVNLCVPKINKDRSHNLYNSNQTAVQGISDSKKEYLLTQNGRVCFNPDTKICYSVKNPGIVTLKIYDSEGTEISTIVNEFQSSGDYEVHFSSNTPEFSGIKSGLYYYTIEINNFGEIKSKI